MTHSRDVLAMPESLTQPQLDTLSDTQPVVSEPVFPREPPPARWRVNRSALLLIGVPLAGALLVWLGISIFSSNPTTPPAAVTELPATEPARETQPTIDAQPAIDATVADSTEAEQASAPAPVGPEPSQLPEGPPSAIHEVTPKVPQSALDTITGTVRVSVRVTIDKEGAVVDATADDPGPSRYFERLSVDASKKWTFTAANSQEQRTMLVKFNFKREGVTTYAEPDEERD